jgi:hypothetical protein
MAKTSGRWVVYEYNEGQFVFLSKPHKTKEQAERERSELTARRKSRSASLGVGFVLISE